MIGKVDHKAFPNLRDLSPQNLPRGPIHSAFQSILEEKIEGSKPLETMVIQFLSRIIEAILSDRHPEDTGFPISNPFSPNGPAQPLPEGTPPLPESIKEGVPEVSIKLQGEQDFESFVEEAGGVHGVDPALIRAVIQVESGGNPVAISRAGARGLMQLMPGTAAELGVRDSFDPRQNIEGGTRYLKKLLDRYQGTLNLALAAYNWGMGNLERNPEAMPRETKNYITKVQNQYTALKHSDESA
jgi:hypothetical protein